MRPLSAVLFLVVLAFESSIAVSSFTTRPEVPGQLEAEARAIYGTVLLQGSRDPVPGSTVRLRAQRSDFELTAVADDSGRFGFSGLAPGGYQLTPTAEGNGQELIGTTRSFTFTDAGLPPNLEVWMAPVSVVSGHVVDSASGEPVVGARVDAVRSVYLNGHRVLAAADGRRLSFLVGLPPTDSSAITDQEGRYSVSLTPEEYYLRVSSPDGMSYYPGVVHAEEAATLSLRNGVDFSGIDISMTTEVYPVRFRLDLPNFLPGDSVPLSTRLREETVRVGAYVVPLGLGLIHPTAFEVEPTASDNGTWSLPPLPPGGYDVLLTYRRSLLTHPELRAIDWDQADPIASAGFVIDDSDVDLETIPVPAKPSISGRLLVRSTQGAEPDLSELPPVLIATSDFPINRTARDYGPDGTFRLDGLFTQRFGVFLRPLPEGWYVRSITSGSQDVLKDGLLVDGPPLAPMEILISDDAGRIEGVVRTREGRLAADARVVLVPPPNLRGPAARLPAVVADWSGAYAVDGVPPGEYRLLALDEAGRDDPYPYWEDPEFLRDYELRGERITVDPGARMTINPEAIPIHE